MGRKKKKSNMYWTQEHEDAIVKFLKSQEAGKQDDRLFTTVIYPAIVKLTENILFTYRLSIPSEDPQDQIADAISFLYGKLDKFKPAKGKRAFGYYGTIVKHYLMGKKIKWTKMQAKMSDISNLVGIEEQFETLNVTPEIEEHYESTVFMLDYLSSEIKSELSTDISYPINTYLVGDAVVYLLEHYTSIHINNKNQAYFLLREMTGLSSKEITKALVDVKDIYGITMKKFK